MDEWCLGRGSGHKVFGQIIPPKSGGYSPKNFEWVARLTPLDYAARFAEADLIVSHAGMGSIITALHDGKPIVIMPRRAHLHEQRNDHQLATVQMLGNRPGIHVAEDETCLADAIDQALTSLSDPTRPRLPDLADAGFTGALRSFLAGR